MVLLATNEADEADEAAGSVEEPADDAARPAEQAATAIEGAAATLALVPEATERVQDYAGRSKSAATIKAYAAGWRDFLDFCAERGLGALPASDRTVAAYLAALADRGAKAATIARRLVVISQAHKAADLPSPTSSSLVRRVHAGIRHTHGTAQQGKAPVVKAFRTLAEQDQTTTR